MVGEQRDVAGEALPPSPRRAHPRARFGGLSSVIGRPKLVVVRVPGSRNSRGRPAAAARRSFVEVLPAEPPTADDAQTPGRAASGGGARGSWSRRRTSSTRTSAAPGAEARNFAGVCDTNATLAPPPRNAAGNEVVDRRASAAQGGESTPPRRSVREGSNAHDVTRGLGRAPPATTPVRMMRDVNRSSTYAGLRTLPMAASTRRPSASCTAHRALVPGRRESAPVPALDPR